MLYRDVCRVGVVVICFFSCRSAVEGGGFLFLSFDTLRVGCFLLLYTGEPQRGRSVFLSLCPSCISLLVSKHEGCGYGEARHAEDGDGEKKTVKEDFFVL